MDNMSRDELSTIISDSVDQSVDRAFQKYGFGKKKKKLSVRAIIILILIVIAIAAVMGIRSRWASHKQNVKQLSDYDLTLKNNGIFGFKAADFATPILGEAEQKKLLIVEEREASVNTTITDAGLFHLGIFSKSQVLTIHGKGEYTIDLSKISEEDISLSANYVVTVLIPHAELHTVTFDPDQTEVGDTSRGWLAFGDIKLNADQTKTFESTAKSKLTEALSTEDSLEEADKFAKMTATEEMQKIINEVSPAYKVSISFQEE